MRKLMFLLLSTAAFAQNHQAVLNWNVPIQPPSVTYQIYRSTSCTLFSCTNYVQIVSVPDPITSYTDSLPNLASGKHVCYYLVATNGSDAVDAVLTKLATNFDDTACIAIP